MDFPTMSSHGSSPLHFVVSRPQTRWNARRLVFCPQRFFVLGIKTDVHLPQATLDLLQHAPLLMVSKTATDTEVVLGMDIVNGLSHQPCTLLIRLLR